MNLPPNFIDCEQQSKAWFECRLGCVTSSRIADVVKKRKKGKNLVDGGEDLQCRTDMRWELAIELLTNRPTPNYVSRWMKEGKEKEPMARTEYEMRNGVRVTTVGFAYHPLIKMAGASPDGLVGTKGLIEIKCPKVETHLDYLVNDKIPEEYIPQMVWQLACCPDWEWNDFVSFYCPLTDDDATLPDEYCFFQKRMYRTKEVDDLIRDGFNPEVDKFNVEVMGKLEQIKAKAVTVAA